MSATVTGEQEPEQEGAIQPFYHTSLRVRDFEVTYKVHAPLLPFGYMETDGFERLQKVTEFLNGRPRSCQYVSKKMLYGPKVLDIERTSGQALLYPNLYCLISGWWPAEGSNHSDREYQNPNHYHQGALETIDDPADRARLFRQTASLGLLSSPDVAPMIGHESRRGVPRCVRKTTGKEWGELRHAGRVRLARTLKTVHAWSDYTYNEIEEAFGLPYNTAPRRIREFAPDFWPPKDPSYPKNLEVVLAEVREHVE